jgi:hypothetical protein
MSNVSTRLILRTKVDQKVSAVLLIVDSWKQVLLIVDSWKQVLLIVDS